MSHTVLQTDKRVVETGVCQEGRRLPGRRMRNQHAPALQRVYADFIFRVDADEFACTELEKSRGRLARELEDHRHPPLPEDIDLTTSELGVAGADGNEGLNGIVRDRAYL